MPKNVQRNALPRFARALGIAIAASAALALPAQAAAYMKLGDIKGQTQTGGKKDFYKGWIELNSVACNGGATSRSTPSVGEIVVTKATDQASPKLAEASASGRVFPSAQIHLVNAGAASAYLTYKLNSVRVTSYTVNGSGLDDGSIPTETLSLNFDKITWRAEGGLKGESCPD
ncbi:MAG: type VI secretion system tube protein Hcp [Parvularculaceae bacterium]